MRDFGTDGIAYKFPPSRFERTKMTATDFCNLLVVRSANRIDSSTSEEIENRAKDQCRIHTCKGLHLFSCFLKAFEKKIRAVNYWYSRPTTVSCFTYSVCNERLCPVNNLNITVRHF